MEARKRTFLTALAIAGVVTSACETTGVSRKTAYIWRDSDPAFAEEWDDAIATATDRLETEAHRRAVLGVDEPVFHRGQLVFKRDAEGEIVRDSNGDPIPMTVPKRSDRLLELMLQAKRPDQYGRKTVDLNQRIEKKPEVKADVMARLNALPQETRLRLLRMIAQVHEELDAAAPLPLAPVEHDFEEDPTRDAF